MSKPHSKSHSMVRLTGLLFVAIIVFSALIGFGPSISTTSRAQRGEPLVPLIAPGSAYRQTNLISDIPGLAPVLDPLLVNPWGISMTGSSPFWVVNNRTSTTQLIRGDVSGAPTVLNASPQTVTIPGSLPTGTVANPVAGEFVLPGPCSAAPCGANFLFASITGNISGWDPNAPAAGSTTAVIAVHPPPNPLPRVYTGLAYANNGSANFIYAADFANGKIDVFNTSFVLQPAASFPFADPTIPTTPGNTYHPFNIQAIGGLLYVTYAKVGPDGKDEEGVGNGFVRRFNTDGVRDLTFGINNGALNSPWGIVLAPSTFGIFGGALLVGNFGEGNPSIHAFTASGSTPGAFLGTLQNENGDGIVIDELWALVFGNGGSGGDPNTLYFSAGTAEEDHGLFGKLQPTTASATSLIQFATDELSISEGSGHIDITVTRAGDVSGNATVNFNTFDESQPGHASQKNDYEIALGTLRFAPGETSKTFRILIVDDKDYAPFPAGDEGDEVIDLALSNPTGAGVGLGSPNTAEVTILDNDTVAPVSNPIDNSTFFVRQQYLDLDNREPDAAATAFINDLASCSGSATCIDAKQVSIANTFFQSPDFQRTGYLAYLTSRAAFGGSASGSPAAILYGNFEHDIQALQSGFVTGQPGAEAVLEANKVAFFNEYVTRPEFVSKYPSTLTNQQYVDNLLASAGLSPSQVRFFSVNLTNGQEVPPTVPTTTTGAARPASSGTARFQFNDTQTAMTFSATISNIDVTGAQSPDTNDNLTNAHIHAGPSVAPGVNGPVVWGFFGAPFNDNTPNDSIFFPNAGVGGSFSGKWDAPEGNGTTLAAQLTNLREGRAYINFHTRQFSGGEIRGNFPAADSFRNQLVAGLNGATLTRAQVLRAVAESEELSVREQNLAFVAMAYFVYFRRDPDTAGYNSLVARLNTLGDFLKANLIGNFIRGSEYRQRFGTDPAGLFLNDSPTANNDTASTNAATPVFINVLANDTDPDSDFLTITSVTPGTGGTPKISPDGRSIIFIPTPGFAGAASFQYTVNDNGMSCPTGVCAPQDFTYNSLSASATVNVTVNSAGTFQLGAAAVSVLEGAGKVTLTVTLTGGSSTPVTVNFATAPDAAIVNCATVSGQASERCDFNTTRGTLTFAPGETSKTFDVFILDDAYVEGSETFNVSLSNPSGGPSFTLGIPATETVTITDNDAAPGPNPIDSTPFFVRQHYIDFLNREPEPTGFNDWVNILNGCAPGNTACDRVEVSSAFYRSEEFQVRGYFVYRFYAASLGRIPKYPEFMMDLSRVTGFLTPAQLEANKIAFIADFMSRSEFTTKYDPVPAPADYVNLLESTAGVTLSNKAALISGLQGGTETRATVLRKVAESPEVTNKFFNEAFVVEAYFGYLRRNPDALFTNWMTTLNSTGNYRLVVNGFVNSIEYRQRFGP